MNQTRETYGVIFDMDGVLILSYRPHFESWRTTARLYGLDMTEPQFARQFGRTSREIIRDLWGETIGGVEIRAFDERKEAIYRDLIRTDVPATPGLFSLLRSLAEDGAKMAVGSSGPLENINLVLEGLAIRPYFSAVVSARDVTKGKPDPEVFLTAAKTLGVDPARCVVVEDAPAGIEAARRGGMKVIALTTSYPAEKLTAADFVTTDLTGITPGRVYDLIGYNPASHPPST